MTHFAQILAPDSWILNSRFHRCHMKLIRQTKLVFQEGRSDKVYEVDLCEVGANRYVVNFRYGRRGANLKEGAKTAQPVALAEAEKVFASLVAEKTRKG